ncbi:phospholipase C/P1 nuclease family protein [Subtercola frigoramans]|uniref:S1/P1 Nuclease n=1 Tax=Subtercola frigoramans TaxID=120298 RepID=A0ABS2L0C6_9MICO|nr:hypothetical protein [Subtercola frigoramans]MBM7470530.1 hypothetical protein [Subtercola frigoramans]
MTSNVDRISFALRDLVATDINNGTIAGKKAGGFIPLADVPDLVWKNLPSAVKGGRDTAFRTGPEHTTHFADADQPRPSDQKTIRELCMQDPANVNVAVWQEYYTSLGHTDPGDRGLLPFRVWQFFDEMVAAIKAKNLTRYVAAAGLVAHYVGDACQPLHGSYLADGLPDGTGSGVHSAYESTMVDRHDTDILTALTTALKNADPHPTVTTGQQVAVEIVNLMDRSAKAIDPKTLVLAYAAVAMKKGDSSVKVTDALWAQFGQQTVGLFADGALTLAMVWQSAWNAAKGDTKLRATTDVSAIATGALQALYEDPGFVPSLDLDHIGTVLQSSARKES